MKNYIIKIALRGVSPMIWRRLLIPEATSIATLHDIIQIVYGWDNEYLHRFHIYAVDYGISYAGGLIFRKDARKICIDDFEFDAGDKFFYEYNFFKNLIVDIRIEKIIEESTAKSSIYCLKGNGMPETNKHDEVKATLDLFKAIAEADKRTTVGDIRSLIEALNATKFNRYHINHLLKAELSPI